MYKTRATVAGVVCSKYYLLRRNFHRTLYLFVTRNTATTPQKATLLYGMYVYACFSVTHLYRILIINLSLGCNRYVRGRAYYVNNFFNKGTRGHHNFYPARCLCKQQYRILNILTAQRYHIC